jgi:glycerol-3-phosphate acyltransferase PlsY
VTAWDWLGLFLLGEYLAFALCSFLLGSIPFGWIFARMKGIDLKQVGSGNIGATNAARALGRPLGVLVLVLDAGKAFLPTFLALETPVVPHLWIPGFSAGLIGFFAICGHVFSPWMGWKGGKGVASMLGVFLALSPLAAAIAAAVWLLAYLAFRISSVGSLLACVALAATLVVTHAPAGYLVAVAATVALVVARHIDNIRRLFARRETRV